MTEKLRYVEVAFPMALQQCFTYALVPDTPLPVFPGQRVVVPLRRSYAIGFVVNTDSIPPPGITIRNILEQIDPTPIFPPENFAFLAKIAHYYLTPIGKVLAAAIPKEYQVQKSRRIYASKPITDVQPSENLDLYHKIQAHSGIQYRSLKQQFDSHELRRGLTYLKRFKLISEEPLFQQPIKSREIITNYRLAEEFRPDPIFLESLKRKAPRQWEIIKEFIHNGGLLGREVLSRFSRSALQRLIAKGWLSVHKTDVTLSNLWADFQSKDKDVTLNDEQGVVFEQICATLAENNLKAFLLQGITGSGKTEVYIKLIQQTIARRLSAIVLVPEITLTTHLASRFRGAFGEKIAIWHSHLATAQRSTIWQAVKNGQFPVVIGARSAIFLPIPNLGLIIIDEEQDHSFKQKGQDPKYHARDAALIRAKECGATVLMGSATPSLEALYNVTTKKFAKIELQQRFSTAPSPIIHLVDLKKDWEENSDYNNPFSRLLISKIDEKIKRNEQILLMQNRRGYSNTLLCPACGWTPRCRNCDISLTYHKKAGALVCHYCNLHEPPPVSCPDCGSHRFLYPGFGTQKVEDYLETIFPGLKMGRLDLDTAGQKNYLARMMRKFDEQKIRVLIGTQMIAKGLDFPNVSLVGVLNADIGLYLPDFRARERVFQLLYQVAGRTGRGPIQGEVVIQTFNPQDFTIRCALQQNLTKFYNFELSERLPTNYPPFSRIASILISDLSAKRAWQVATDVAMYLQNHKHKLEILGPAPAPIARIKNRHRNLMVIKSSKKDDPNGSRLHSILNNMLRTKKYASWKRNARISIDIDPLDLL
jgi:primosomal protein N' (replication factor Y)